MESSGRYLGDSLVVQYKIACIQIRVTTRIIQERHHYDLAPSDRTLWNDGSLRDITDLYETHRSLTGSPWQDKANFLPPKTPFWRSGNLGEEFKNEVHD